MYRSWGYSPTVKQVAVRPNWRDYSLSLVKDKILPFGNGRSYGDSCLNSSGQLIDSRSLNRFISFDKEQGILRCEAGVTFHHILETIVPAGWFLPVTPGTKFVTLGGAIANDVHGKNHHKDGSLGRHVIGLELLRSNGERLFCSADSNSDLFEATIGGLGLTGFVTWAEIKLMPVSSDLVDVEIIPFYGLDQFYELSGSASNDYQYTVAWLDCIARGKNFARGLFMQANHSKEYGNSSQASSKRKLNVPFNFPGWCLNKYSIGAFNNLYFYMNKKKAHKTIPQHYDSFFYPLDGVNNWNRIYGKEGFYQYQFVVPKKNVAAMENILRKIVSSGLGSFLAVLKEFGELESPGMLSFPRSGICLALDFSNRGEFTRRVLDELDTLVMDAGGAVYPAKDVRMSAQAFKAYYPAHEKFVQYMDPNFTSDFWERVHV